ncbi:MFS transporter permease [Angustibacter sp. McL0619]|uniref:MFS transporter permease n=1 Tax=Angustibacter sp. McL0619 TaxID=3415676 RepID=UPI003CEF461C
MSPEPVMSPVRRWLFAPVPMERVALLRLAVYAFVIIDVLFLHTSGFYHGWADPVWYQPLHAGTIFHLPAATVLLVELLKWGSVAGAVVAMTGRYPRAAGWFVALTWAWYQYVAFAYGKVDHDRGDFVLALLLLPTVGTAHLNDKRLSEAAGFAIRAVQLGAIATYFLSGVAKLRFGGPEWVNSATLVRAVVRRGTPIGDMFLHTPWVLHAGQWFIMTAELLSWTIFILPERWRRLMVLGWYLFHATVYATITIAFWPHLVMMLAFLPLEGYRDRLVGWWRSRGQVPVGDDVAAQ